MSTPPSKNVDSRKQQATLENLPDDVLCNIFMRLPVKLLAQMKSLCKPWNAFLSHPYFIKSHLHHSIHNNPEVILVFLNKAFCDYKLLKFTAHSSQSPDIQLTNFIKPPPLVTNIHNPQRNYVIGSVNGLIGLCTITGGKRYIRIWNPSLSALIDIPTPTIPCNLSVLLQFGFDPKNDDYKVFKATFFADDNIDRESLQVEVYSMRKSVWESITVRFPSHIRHILKCNDVAVDGHDGRLHWICYVDDDWYEQTLLVFDLGDETFSEISLPHSIRFGGINVVGVVSQKLCVVSSVEGDCDMWVMDTYGAANSWVKHHVLKRRINDSITPLGFTSSNKLVFQICEYDLALYDPNADAVRFFDMETLTAEKSTRSFYLCTIVPYVESLVLPGSRAAC